MSRHARDKWFLWVHYLDPHGRYVAHPDDVSWGTSEEDLYDGELRFTDTHLGRLFKELARLPGADHTIIVLTSDHGDAFNEHGVQITSPNYVVDPDGAKIVPRDRWFAAPAAPVDATLSTRREP